MPSSVPHLTRGTAAAEPGKAREPRNELVGSGLRPGIEIVSAQLPAARRQGQLSHALYVRESHYRTFTGVKRAGAGELTVRRHANGLTGW
jgi:hypothetical protein